MRSRKAPAASERPLVTGNCGPKALRVLRAAAVAVFTSDASTVAEALARYRAGELTEIASFDVKGHWV